MPDLNPVGSWRQVRNRKLAVLIRHGVVRIVHDDHLTLHPAMDGTLDIDEAYLLKFALIHLTLNGLRNVKQAVVALKKLNVVEYGITVH